MTTEISSSTVKEPNLAAKYPEIKVLTLDDTEKAAKCLLEAFDGDSLAAYLGCHFKYDEYKKYCELKLYEAYVRQHIVSGLVIGILDDTKEGFDTVAMWSLPDSHERGLDDFSVLMRAGYDQVWNIYGEEGRQKIFDGMWGLLHDSCVRILSTDSRFADKKLFTLVYIGSTVNARGKGNVRKMFDYMFELYIDVCPNSLSYLESSSKTNIPIYNKFGFHMYEDIVLGTKKDSNSKEGVDYSIMNVMIRGTNGHDWTKDANVTSSKL